MEDTLEDSSECSTVCKQEGVLILVLMEDTLEVTRTTSHFSATLRLNPCFNGRYSRS